jgi:hypothetical protein
MSNLSSKNLLNDLEKILNKKSFNKKSRVKALELITGIRTISEISEKKAENLNKLKSIILEYEDSTEELEKFWSSDPDIK